MRPLQRTFNPQKKSARPARFSLAALEEALPGPIAAIAPTDCEVLELNGEDAVTAWQDSVFVIEFTNAFEDSVIPAN